MLALAGSGDPSSHSAKSTKRFRHRNQSDEEVALSNAEANLFGNRWGKLYERYKRNWIPTGDSCAVSTIGRNSFRHVLVATASVTPSVFVQRFDGWKASSWARNPTPPRSGEVDRSRSTRDHNSDDGVPMRCRISSMPTWQDQYTLGNF